MTQTESQERAPRPVLSRRFRSALAYAARIHRDQARKGSEIPYVAHVLAVTAIVLEHGGTEEQAIAALLHDTIEDQPREGKTRAEIVAHFGERIAQMVESLSDATSHPKPPWRERKERYLAHLPDSSPEVLLVSCADKLHNVRAIVADLRQIGDAVWQRFKASKEDALWYYRSLVNAFREAGLAGPLLDELERAVTEIEQLTSPR